MPKITGIFFYCCLILTAFACSKDDDTNNGEDDPNTEDVLYFFRGEVDGQDIAIEVTSTNENINYLLNGGSIGIENCTIDYGGSIGDQSENPPNFSFELLSFYNGLCNEETDEFNTLFEIEEVLFYDENNHSNEKRVAIYYLTDEGEYASRVGDQTNSNFSITSVDEANNAFGLYQDIEATFDCTLYNIDDVSKTIEIKNGSFKLNVGSYYN